MAGFLPRFSSHADTSHRPLVIAVSIAEFPQMNTLHLHLCKDCLTTDAPATAATLQGALDADLPGQVAVALSPCIERCDAPLALTLQSENGAGYVFAGIKPETDLTDIVATCQAYLDSPDGWIEDARPCGRLRFCLAARLPA